jgi:hypothetical protein
MRTLGDRVKAPLRRANAPLAGVVLALVAFGWPRVARADDTTAAARAAAARLQDQPHTAAEFTTGFLLLPGALVCPTSVTSCKRGDFSFALGLQNMYRFHHFAVGAGIIWATTLRSDAAAGDPSLQREHSRSYFLVEGIGRYYFPRAGAWDFWAGGTVGLVVLSDSWSTIADRDPYEGTASIGPQAQTLGTEGFAIGVGGGAEWSFLPNWSFGPAVRYANWFLPSTRATTPTLDVASLAGRLDVIDVTVHITFRVAL